MPECWRFAPRQRNRDLSDVEIGPNLIFQQVTIGHGGPVDGLHASVHVDIAGAKTGNVGGDYAGSRTPPCRMPTAGLSGAGLNHREGRVKKSRGGHV
jgi:hypothetical protein